MWITKNMKCILSTIALFFFSVGNLILMCSTKGFLPFLCGLFLCFIAGGLWGIVALKADKYESLQQMANEKDAGYEK